MEIKIEPYDDKNLKALEKIAKESFKLDSFHTDPHFDKKLADEFIWKVWTLPAILREKRHCFVAYANNNCAGFIIYGADSGYYDKLGLKIGTIILLATHPDYQGNNIAKLLVEKTIQNFRHHKFDLITVGTDLQNTPALSVYQRYGFKPIFYWTILRYYSKFDAQSNIVSEQITEYQGEDIAQFPFLLDGRLPSLFFDRKISTTVKIKIKELIKNNILSEFSNQILTCFVSKRQNQVIGYITYGFEQENSAILNQRLYKVLDFYAEDIEIAKGLVNKILQQEGDDIIIEKFSGLHNLAEINLLTKIGFNITYFGVVLHYWDKNF